MPELKDTDQEFAVRNFNASMETQILNHSCPSQEEQILNYLRQGNSLTPLTALKLFGCFRLGARCFALKKKGYAIKSVTVNDGGKRFSRYWMEG